MVSIKYTSSLKDDSCQQSMFWLSYYAVSLFQYKNPDITKRDVLSVFTNFSDLRPKLEEFGKYNGFDIVSIVKVPILLKI